MQQTKGNPRLMQALARAVVPIACAWAKWHEARILRRGVALSEWERVTAKKIGVAHPDRIRLMAVDVVPPTNWFLQSIGERLGLVSFQVAGMTLRYGIFIRRDHWGNQRLLTHEMAHVVQYERLGGFRRFLSQYLRECIEPGYPLGELEQEAKRAEVS